MAKEIIDVTLEADRIVVEAVFYFSNEGQATEVDMLIPFKHWGGFTQCEPHTSDEYFSSYREDFGIDPKSPRNETIFKSAAELPKRHSGLCDYVDSFSVTIDGENANSEIVEITELSEDSGEYSGELFARWTISFNSNEERKVTCTYKTPYSIDDIGIGPHLLDYALYTGADWAEQIGGGTITIINKSGSALWFDTPEDVGLAPAAIYTREGNDVIELSFSEFEPFHPNRGGTSISVFLAQTFERVGLTNTYDCLGLPFGTGMPGRTTIEMNFRTEPSGNAPKVADHPVLEKHTPFDVIDGKGEWWQVKLADGTAGWLRWRYVDDGVEKHYAEFYWVSDA
ncbi:MAG: hypothetical protein GY771_03925 [bacterium]|nr:hypothetical protein [bacterium]